jgi:hypothetical protein
VWIFDLHVFRLYLNQFIGDKEEKRRISSGWRRGLGSDSAHWEDDGVLPGLPWASCWAAAGLTRGEGGAGQAGPAIGFRPKTK